MEEPSKVETVTYYTEVGAALGAAFGAALSGLFGDSGAAIPIGLALGVALGASAGQFFKARRPTDSSAHPSDNESPN